MNVQPKLKLKPKIILGVMAHPDDIDFCAAGTMAKYARDGAKVHYLILTDGGKGTDDRNLSSSELTRIRRAEQQAALDIVGGTSVEFLDYSDGGLEVTMDLKKDIVKAIRTVKPDVVVTMDPTFVYSAQYGIINHPDHRAAGQATLDSVFPLARDHLSFPDLHDGGYEPHKTPTVLLVNFEKSDYVVDISDTFDLKIGALKEHVSQFGDMQATVDAAKELAESVGKTAGYKYAESFVRIDIG